MLEEDKNVRGFLVLGFLNLMTSGENEHYSKQLLDEVFVISRIIN